MPLQFPPEWKRVVEREFPLGVPFVGAQVGVYKSIVQQLASRNEECWLEWGPDVRRVELARFAAARFGEAADWPRPIFVPDDPFVLVAWDHTACAIDDLRIDAALEAIDRHVGLELTAREFNALWESLQDNTFGQVVDELLRLTGACRVMPSMHSSSRLGLGAMARSAGASLLIGAWGYLMLHWAPPFLSGNDWAMTLLNRHPMGYFLAELATPALIASIAWIGTFERSPCRAISAMLVAMAACVLWVTLFDRGFIRGTLEAAGVIEPLTFRHVSWGSAPQWWRFTAYSILAPLACLSCHVLLAIKNRPPPGHGGTHSVAQGV